MSVSLRLFVADPHSFILLQFLQNVVTNITKFNFMKGLVTLFARGADPDLAFAQTFGLGSEL